MSKAALIMQSIQKTLKNLDKMLYYVAECSSIFFRWGEQTLEGYLRNDNHAWSFQKGKANRDAVLATHFFFQAEDTD